MASTRALVRKERKIKYTSLVAFVSILYLSDSVVRARRAKILYLSAIARQKERNTDNPREGGQKILYLTGDDSVA